MTDEEVDIGIDVTGDKEPDFWVKLVGKKEIIGLILISFGLGLLIGKYLL